MYTTAPWRSLIFYQNQRIYHVIKITVVVIKKNTLIGLSYFQVIYSLSVFPHVPGFGIIIFCSGKGMEVLRGWLSPPRWYNKNVAKSIFWHWVSILFLLHSAARESFPKVGYIILKGDIFPALLRVESKMWVLESESWSPICKSFISVKTSWGCGKHSVHKCRFLSCAWNIICVWQMLAKNMTRATTKEKQGGERYFSHQCLKESLISFFFTSLKSEAIQYLLLIYRS